jgi:hypothetical protein
MLSYSEIEDASLPQLLRWWDGAEPPPADFEDDFLPTVAFGLIKHRPEGLAVVKRDLSSHDPGRRDAALSALAYPDVADDEVRVALVQTFRDNRISLTTTALWGLIHLGYFPLDKHEIDALLGGEDDRLAALAMVYLSRARPDEAVKILEAALNSPNPRMREYACDEVGDRGISELSERLRPLLADPNCAVAAAARSNLGCFAEEAASQVAASAGAVS